MRVIKPSATVYFHYPSEVHLEHDTKVTGEPIVPEKFFELAGRTCYKSEEHITENSASKFVEMLQKRGHLAMLEHCFASVKFVCDRGVTHELVRHRIVSYAQESTRYCDYTKDKFKGQIAVVRPMDMSEDATIGFDKAEYLPATQDWIRNLLELLQNGKYPEAEEEVQLLLGSRMTEAQLWRLAMHWSEQSYQMMRKLDSPAQRARHVLPIGLKTEIWASANLREWQHIFNLRCANTAHPHIRSLMLIALDVFRRVVPKMFEPLWEKYGK